MKIGIVTSEIMGETDRLISETAAKLQAQGGALAGITKVLGNEAVGDHHCDMDVRVLPNGPEIRITQSLGEGSTGCRLNPAGIAEAVAAVENSGIAGAGLFVLNKFGPQEADGHGFCEAIGTALEHDIPVLVGVGKGSRAALERFVDGMAEALPPEPDAIYAWCKGVMPR
ncbi:MAG TPA: DUF2478 domain-containing protein [Rhodobacteraceae bacterium]|nr:DUF2478 domain-containing protein [Paracoccaceae bacterium]